MTGTLQKMSLMSLEDAIAQMLSSVQMWGDVEQVSTFDADGRVLAADVVSPLNVPAFDNSQMDGYAVRVADFQNADGSQVASTLPCSQRIAAGQTPSALQAKSVARIFTGAPIPDGADAVVMQEETTLTEDGSVCINIAPKAGQWIRRAGEDVQAGAVVLPKGTRLNPQGLGLAASVGAATLSVSRKPRVALFSTGDELVMPGDVAPENMMAGAIYNSNRFFLRALLMRMGCEVTDLGIVPDKREATVKALSDAALSHDLIVTSGGVSVGEEDHIKPAVQQLGNLNLWQIGMKPGKPFAFGRIAQTPLSLRDISPTSQGQTKTDVLPYEVGGMSRSDRGVAPSAYFVGLPGNPVSSFVTFLLLVRPLLLKLQGASNWSYPVTQMRADFEVTKADKRREFLRVRRHANGGLDLFRNQSSGVLTSTVWGDGLVDNPAGTTIGKGQLVNYISFTDLLG